MNITIVGVPYSLDQRQVGMGAAPDALLGAGLVERLVKLGHDVRVELVTIPESEDARDARLGRLLSALAGAVVRVRAAGRFPLILGGDCMVSLGVLGGLGDAANTGIVWLDAHGDFNTAKTTISGYLGGMPLACVVGRGLTELREQCKLITPVPERNVALIGVRDLDRAEEQLLLESAVALVRGPELERDPAVLDHALHGLSSLPQLYLHVDIDVLDPAEAPGVDYPVVGGLRLDELRRIVQYTVGLGNIVALAITAVNPEKDIDERTVIAALAVIEAALAPDA